MNRVNSRAAELKTELEKLKKKYIVIIQNQINRSFQTNTYKITYHGVLLMIAVPTHSGFG